MADLQLVRVDVALGVAVEQLEQQRAARALDLRDQHERLADRDDVLEPGARERAVVRRVVDLPGGNRRRPSRRSRAPCDPSSCAARCSGVPSSTVSRPNGGPPRNVETILRSCGSGGSTSDENAAASTPLSTATIASVPVRPDVALAGRRARESGSNSSSRLRSEGFWSAIASRAAATSAGGQDAEGAAAEAERARDLVAQRALELVLRHLLRGLVRDQPLEVDLPRSDAGVPAGPGCTADDEQPLLQARVHPLESAQERDPVEQLLDLAPDHGPATTGAPVRCRARLRTMRISSAVGVCFAARVSSRRSAVRPSNQANGASATRTAGANTGPRSRAGAGELPSRSISSATRPLAERSRPSGRTNRLQEALVPPVVAFAAQRRLQLLGVLVEGARDVQQAELVRLQVVEVERPLLSLLELVGEDRVHGPADDRALDLRGRVDPDDRVRVVERVEVVVARRLVVRRLAEPRPDLRALAQVDVRPLRGVQRVRPDEEPGLREHAAACAQPLDPAADEVDLVPGDEARRADVEHDRPVGAQPDVAGRTPRG